MIAWIQSHWAIILLAIGWLMTVLQTITVHWSEKKGLVKVLLFIVDLLSVVKTGGGLKVPGLPTGATGIFDGKSLLLLVGAGLLAASMLSGCCTTARCWLAAGLDGVHKADPLAVEAIKQVCAPKVQACSSPASCPALTQCQQALTIYQTSADAVCRELETANKVLSDLGVK